MDAIRGSPLRLSCLLTLEPFTSPLSKTKNSSSHSLHRWQKASFFLTEPLSKWRADFLWWLSNILFWMTFMNLSCLRYKPPSMPSPHTSLMQYTRLWDRCYRVYRKCYCSSLRNNHCGVYGLPQRKETDSGSWPERIDFFASRLCFLLFVHIYLLNVDNPSTHIQQNRKTFG